MLTITRADIGDIRMLKAVAHPCRLAIVRRLGSAIAEPACTLNACCNITQSTLSHHLKVLRDADWVRRERHGTELHYSLLPGALARFRGLAPTTDRAASRAHRPGTG